MRQQSIAPGFACFEILQWKGLALGLLALLFVALQSAASFAETTNRRAVAVIMGNSNYAGSIPKVDFALNDADAFKTFVVDVLGYDPDNIIDMRDATKAEMETAFGNSRSYEGKLWRYLDPKGRSDVVVFYSGHGVPGLKDKRGYLLPVDADANAPEINGYPLDLLLGNLGKLKVKSLSVYIDACFSGESPKGMLVQSASGISIVPQMPSQSSAMTLITAAQGDQVASWDNKAKHGMFTKHLLDALYGKADDKLYGNADGKVALSEVREYLDDRMTRSARREFGRHQNAWFSGQDEQLLVQTVSAAGRPETVRAAPVVKKPKPVVVAKPVVAPRPAVVVRAPVKPVAPAFDVVGLERNSTWRVTIDFDEIWSANFADEINIVNGKISESLYKGGLILNIWGHMRRGVMELNGRVADHERFVHAPWGPAVEMVPHTFETISDVTGPTFVINTTAGADFTGDKSPVKIRFSLLRRS
jgi:hypothetical protein